MLLFYSTTSERPSAAHIATLCYAAQCVNAYRDGPIKRPEHAEPRHDHSPGPDRTSGCRTCATSSTMPTASASSRASTAPTGISRSACWRKSSRIRIRAARRRCCSTSIKGYPPGMRIVSGLHNSCRRRRLLVRLSRQRRSDHDREGLSRPHEERLQADPAGGGERAARSWRTSIATTPSTCSSFRCR